MTDDQARYLDARVETLERENTALRTLCHGLYQCEEWALIAVKNMRLRGVSASEAVASATEACRRRWA